MKRAEIETVLKQCLFFKDLEKCDLQKVTSLCKSKDFDIGMPIFQQGDQGDCLYVIVEGMVDLQRSVTLSGRVGEVVIEKLGRNRVLGCWSTLLNEPHILMSSAVCQKPTKVIVLKGSELRHLMEKEAALGFNILERLCFLLRDRIEHAYGALEKI
jgi:CRP-like cAMP-binding protein